MQMVRWEFPAPVLQFGAGRALWQAIERKTGLPYGQAALPQIAAPAGGHHILPRRPPAMGPRKHMIKGHFPFRAAILAGKLVTEKQIEAREGRVTRGLHIIPQDDDRWQFH